MIDLTGKTIICDIDGTLALRKPENEGGRHPYDMTRVDEDLPNETVMATVLLYHQAGARVVFTSGRDSSCRYETARWIEEHTGIFDFDLMMRETGDWRPDEEVKAEMLGKIQAAGYNILLVLDDRDKVVNMWRSNGLTVFQVAPGPH